MKVNCSFIVISVPVAAGEPFHFLNFAVEAFPQGIGYSVSGIGDDIVNMRFQALCGLDDRVQATVRGPKIPAGEVSLHPTFPAVIP